MVNLDVDSHVVRTVTRTERWVGGSRNRIISNERAPQAVGACFRGREKRDPGAPPAVTGA